MKFGVDISRLNRPCRRALKAVEDIYQVGIEEAVITSTYEGNHGYNSLHYCNDAFDIRTPRYTDKEDMKTSLQDALGIHFDIVLHRSHIHIEYDPK